MNNEVLHGIVPTQWEADGLVADLQTKGFSAKDIHVTFPNDGHGPPEPTQRPRRGKTLLFAALGCLALTIAFGAVGFLSGMGELMIPGLGSLLAAGPLTALYIGMGVGAVTGLLLGGLLGRFISSFQANAASAPLRVGDILVSVHIEGEHQVAIANETFVAHRAVAIAKGPESVPPPAQHDHVTPSPLGA